MKKLPIGIQTFQQLIKGNYIYIDKTESIHKLLEGKYYFISRPRRFGKSLLISTLKELFSGNRELFKGLWIENHMKWKKHPVVHLDFSSISYESPQQLKNELAIKMENIAKIHNISLDQRRDYKGKFHDLLEALGKTVPAVVLIDEYDKPIIDLIHDKKRAKKNRDVLKGFFNMLKSTDEYLRFVLITGVSKFLRVSIFSGLNNLDDITIDDNYSTLMGYSHDELLHYFDDRLAILADKMNLERPLLLEHIKRWYNGYSWDGVQFMYNPFSILALFSKNRFGNYWFATGTPTFLIEHLKEKKKDIRQLEREEVAESILESYDIDNLEVISLLFQTGYLTIKEIRTVGVKTRYILTYPNQEVKESFLKHFLAGYTTDGTGALEGQVLELVESLEAAQIDQFFTIIKSFFARIPSHLVIKEREAYYHTVIYLLLTLLGVNIDVERHTNKGRIDAVIETTHSVYVMEFKMSTASKALKQIESRQYHERFMGMGKKIVLVGVGFDEKERNITTYKLKHL